jgi:hypothetical protein
VLKKLPAGSFLLAKIKHNPELNIFFIPYCHPDAKISVNQFTKSSLFSLACQYKLFLVVTLKLATPHSNHQDLLSQ